MRRWLWIGVAVSVAIVLVAPVTGRYVHGLALVIRAADYTGAIRRVAELDVVPIRERIVRIPVGDDDPILARAYEPIGVARQTVLLVTGVHPAGIDEPGSHMSSLLADTTTWHGCWATSVEESPRRQRDSGVRVAASRQARSGRGANPDADYRPALSRRRDAPAHVGAILELAGFWGALLER
jgi:hypothetical protein